MKAPEQTARFAEIVKACGAPQPVTLWTRPEEDKSFTKAVKEERVLTVKQEPVGTHKDFGVVGFVQEKNVSYLVFPKPLRDFSEKRIIGIKYDLLEVPRPRPQDRVKEKPKKQPQRPTLRHYEVTIRVLAQSEQKVHVEAGNQTQAKQSALEQAASQAPEFASEDVHRKILKTEEI